MKLRDFFPNQILLNADLQELDFYFNRVLKDKYNPAKFIAMVRKRAAREISAGLLFNYPKGLPKDFCEMEMSAVAAAAKQEEPTEGLPESESKLWSGLLFAAQQALMDFPEGHHQKTLQEWIRLTDEQRFAAIRGIEDRMTIGQYGDLTYTPGLRKYIHAFPARSRARRICSAV